MSFSIRIESCQFVKGSDFGESLDRCVMQGEVQAGTANAGDYVKLNLAGTDEKLLVSMLATYSEPRKPPKFVSSCKAPAVIVLTLSTPPEVAEKLRKHDALKEGIILEGREDS